MLLILTAREASQRVEAINWVETGYKRSGFAVVIPTTGSEFVVANTLAKLKKLETNDSH